MPELSFDEFMRGIGANEGNEGGPIPDSQFETTEVITLNSAAAGDSWTIPVTEPISVREVLTRLNLTTSTRMEYWVGDVQIEDTELVAPGATVTAIGQVKGG